MASQSTGRAELRPAVSEGGTHFQSPWAGAAGVWAAVRSGSTRADLWLAAAIGAAFIGWYVWMLHLAGVVFPVPWGDEAAFIWQAAAFAKSWSLYTPEMNPTRHILWMPPGYTIFLGMLFKASGPSLELARTVSGLLVVAAMVLLACFPSRPGTRAATAVLCGVFLINPHFIVAGNIARMEALLLFLVILSFLLMARGLPYLGLALLVVAPLVHPNGGYFAASGWLFAVLARKIWPFNRECAVSARDAVAITVAGLAWVGYLVYAGLHWDALVHDMRWQFATKLGRDITGNMLSGTGLIFIVTATGIASLSLWRREPVGLTLTLAVAAWFVSRVGQEMWYQIYDDVAWLLLCIAAIQLAAGWISQSGPAFAGWKHALTLLALLSGVMLAMYAVDKVEGPRGYIRDMSWSGMRLRPSQPYMEPDDQKALQTFLSGLRKDDGPVWVELYPWSDAFLLGEDTPANIRFNVPTLVPSLYPGSREIDDPIHGTLRRPDVFVVHQSAARPRWLGRQEAIVRERAGIDGRSEQILHRRGESEVWYFRIANPRVHRVSAAH